jgi:chitin synthase
MYNEDDVLFCRTMRGVFQNIAHLCTRTKSKTWGKEGWKKVVVCVVSDGRLKINPRTRSVLAALGVYQDGVGTNFVNGKPVVSSYNILMVMELLLMIDCPFIRIHHSA